MLTTDPLFVLHAFGLHISLIKTEVDTTKKLAKKRMLPMSCAQDLVAGLPACMAAHNSQAASAYMGSG